MKFVEQERMAAGWKFAAVVVLCAATTGISAQDLTTQTSKTPASRTPEVSPGELVRVTVANEIAAANHPELHHMFRSRRQTPKGSQTHMYVETDQALAGMLIAVNDQPLTAEQQTAEQNHLSWLMNNPEQLRKKAAREKEDEDRSLRIVKALPDALCYEYAGTEESSAGLGNPGDQLVKLKFKPNPAYNPPSRVEQVLGAMQGELLIDKQTRRLARIDGTLFQEVTFGWGILGHLNKGGHFLVQQADLGLADGAWGLTRMNLNFSGKILMFKALNLVSEEVLSDFHLMPEKLTFAQGVQILKNEQEKVSHDNQASEATLAKKRQSK